MHPTLQVWKQDLLDYFAWLPKKDSEERGGTEQLSRAAELDERLQMLLKHEYQKWYGNKLQRYCKFRCLKTQREIALGPFVEHARCI